MLQKSWLGIISLGFQYFPADTGEHSIFSLPHLDKLDEFCIWCACSVLSHVRLWDPMDLRLLCLWNFPSKNIRIACHFLLQGVFLIQGLNPGLRHCRQNLHHLKHQGSPTSTISGYKHNIYPVRLYWELNLIMCVHCLAWILTYSKSSVNTSITSISPY